jgi:tRNA-guanine family transglycosylase
MLGPVLVSVHNIRFFQRLMSDIRRAIGEGTFDELRGSDPRSRMGPSVMQGLDVPADELEAG